MNFEQTQKSNHKKTTKNGEPGKREDSSRSLVETTMIFRSLYLLPATKLLAGLLFHRSAGVRCWAALALRDVVCAHIFAFEADELAEISRKLRCHAMDQDDPRVRACLLACEISLRNTSADYAASLIRETRQLADKSRSTDFTRSPAV